jgi:hypothetical protein
MNKLMLLKEKIVVDFKDNMEYIKIFCEQNAMFYMSKQAQHELTLELQRVNTNVHIIVCTC